MSDAFDPYYIWLGIPPDDQPPHHYKLLGIEVFESNRQVIEAAANRQMAYLQEVSAGESHIDEAQKILGELSRARICLLNEAKKEAYDTELRDSFDSLDEAPEAASDVKSANVSTSKSDPADFTHLPDIGTTPAAIPDVPAVGRRPRKPKTSRKADRTPIYIGTAVVAVVVLIGGIALLVSSSNAKKEAARKAEIARLANEQKLKEAEQRAAEAKRKAIEKERNTKQKAQADAERQANAEAARQAKEEAEREAKKEAERQAKEKEKEKVARRDAEQAMAERKLKRREQTSGDQIVWILEDEQTIEYVALQDQQDSEQIEKLESLRDSLLARYADLADDEEIKSCLEQLGGKLATGKDLPFWPDELRDELGQQGLREQPKQDDDEQTVWILEDEQTLLGTLETLESQRADIFALRKTLRKKRGKKTEADATEEKSLVEQFTIDWKKAQDAYDTVNEKYKNLDTTALTGKTARLGSTLGPTLDEKKWNQKLKSFNTFTKRESKSRSTVKPQKRYEFKRTLTLDGTDHTINAITKNIGTPPFITAEAVVKINSGRKYGTIMGQALDNGGTEQGWQLGYNTHVFQWRIGTRGGRWFPQAQSKTTIQGPEGQTVRHVVGTYNGRQMNLYIDGQLENTQDKIRGPINYPNSPFVIGAHKDSDEYIELNGTVFLARVYPAALDAQQVKKLYDEVKDKINKLNNGQ